jgi:hypothetical protein
MSVIASSKHLISHERPLAILRQYSWVIFFLSGVWSSTSLMSGLVPASPQWMWMRDKPLFFQGTEILDLFVTAA